ncbi:MAG TPA: T9SS type A sorting domain-containing protein, partial [Caldithrix sp.]|nr:T9SS type A sorting domain-containing protein [Caldithrix sp.]
IYGLFVRSISLNESNNNNKTLFTWSQDLYGWENYLSNGSSYTLLSTTGQDVQMSNGTTTGTNMMVSSFKHTSSPYYFTNTGNIGGILSKSSNTEINYGRGVALNKEDMHFSYSVKSLSVNGDNIEFAEIPAGKDTTTQRRGIQYLSLDSLNMYLLSEPFTIQKGTMINFSEGSEYYTIAGEDSASEKQIKKNFKVDCKLELIEESTNKSLGTVKQLEYSSDDKNTSGLKSSNLQISNDDVKKVRLKITLKSNVKDVKGVWINEYNTVNKDMLAKLAVEHITLQEPEIPTNFALKQNFPNPFNPVTTIRYNLPEDTRVSLVVYNVNGQKVRELVNDFKPAGSYTVTFDAKGLASGVYFYKINAGKFNDVKRMLLIK